MSNSGNSQPPPQQAAEPSLYSLLGEPPSRLVLSLMAME